MGTVIGRILPWHALWGERESHAGVNAVDMIICNRLNFSCWTLTAQHQGSTYGAEIPRCCSVRDCVEICRKH